MAGVDGFQTIKFVDGPPPESFTDDNPMSDYSSFEQDENNFENQSNLDTLYNSPNTTNWDEITPMTGSHIPGVDTGARGGETTFVGGGGQVQTIGSGMGSFGEGGGASSNVYVAPERSSTASDNTSNAEATGTVQGPHPIYLALSQADGTQTTGPLPLGYLTSLSPFTTDWSGDAFGQGAPVPGDGGLPATNTPPPGAVTLPTITVTPTADQMADIHAEGPAENAATAWLTPSLVGTGYGITGIEGSANSAKAAASNFGRTLRTAESAAARSAAARALPSAGRIARGLEDIARPAPLIGPVIDFAANKAEGLTTGEAIVHTTLSGAGAALGGGIVGGLCEFGTIGLGTPACIVLGAGAAAVGGWVGDQFADKIGGPAAHAIDKVLDDKK